MSLTKVLGIVGLLLTAALMLVNGLFMLLSPRRWFDLPSWVGVARSNDRGKLSSLAWTLQIRVVGLAFVAVVIGLVRALLTSESAPPHTVAWPTLPAVVQPALRLIAMATAWWAGALMLLKPDWWYERYFSLQLKEVPDRYRGAGDVRKPLILMIRIFSIIPIGVALLFTWQFVARYCPR